MSCEMVVELDGGPALIAILTAVICHYRGESPLSRH